MAAADPVPFEIRLFPEQDCRSCSQFGQPGSHPCFFRLDQWVWKAGSFACVCCRTRSVSCSLALVLRSSREARDALRACVAVTDGRGGFEWHLRTQRFLRDASYEFPEAYYTGHYFQTGKPMEGKRLSWVIPVHGTGEGDEAYMELPEYHSRSEFRPPRGPRKAPRPSQSFPFS